MTGIFGLAWPDEHSPAVSAIRRAFMMEDGGFDDDLRARIRGVQKTYGMAVTGLLDDETVEIIVKATRMTDLSWR